MQIMQGWLKIERLHEGGGNGNNFLVRSQNQALQTFQPQQLKSACLGIYDSNVVRESHLSECIPRDLIGESRPRSI